jgi:hypothetical protein
MFCSCWQWWHKVIIQNWNITRIVVLQMDEVVMSERINEIKQQNASSQHVLNTNNYSTYYWQICS